MTKRERLQLLITGKTPKILDGFKAFDKGVANLKTQLEESIRVATLDEVGSKINEVKKSITFEPILKAVAQLKADLEEVDLKEKQKLEAKLVTLTTQLTNADSVNSNNTKSLEEEIRNIHTQIGEILSRKPIEMPDLSKMIRESEMRSMVALSGTKKEKEEQDKKNDKSLEEKLSQLRIELLNRINERGSGNMNRQVLFNTTNYLKKYTDYNLIPGNNVTFVITEDNNNKRVNVRINSSGGGGGSTRSINNVSTNTIVGSDSGTDYVYICSGTITMTMPTTVGNTNLYTIKNAGTGVITIVASGADTLDNDVNIIMPLRYTSVDLISDGVSNWNIT